MNERLGLLDAWSFCSRVRWLLRAQLPEQLALVDDTANRFALDNMAAHGWAAPDPSEYFTTHLDPEAIEAGESTSTDALTVLAVPALEHVERSFVQRGTGVGQARRSDNIDLDILICASYPGTTEVTEDGDTDDWGTTGALARACRVERATVGVLTRYHRFEVLGLSGGELGAIAESSSIGKTGRRPVPRGEEDEQPASTVELVVPVTCVSRRIVRTQ